MNREVFLKLLVTIVALIVIAFTPFFGANNEEIKYEKRGAVETLHEKEEAGNKVKAYKEEQDLAIKEFNERLDELNSVGLSKEDWFRQYKALSEEYSYYISTETIYDKYTASELDLLFRVVQAEIGHGYSFEQKANVCSVIFNRIESEWFGGSLGEVLNGNQFSTISNGSTYKVEVEERTILACEYAYLFGDTTNGALFFNSSGRLNYTFLFNDGAHNFYTKSK